MLEKLSGKVRAALGGSVIAGSTFLGGTVTYWLGEITQNAVGSSVAGSTPAVGFVVGATTAFVGTTYAVASDFAEE